MIAIECCTKAFHSSQLTERSKTFAQWARKFGLLSVASIFRSRSLIVLPSPKLSHFKRKFIKVLLKKFLMEPWSDKNDRIMCCSICKTLPAISDSLHAGGMFLKIPALEMFVGENRHCAFESATNFSRQYEFLFHSEKWNTRRQKKIKVPMRL